MESRYSSDWLGPLVTSLVSFVVAVKHLNLLVKRGREGRKKEGWVDEKKGRKEGGREG